MPRIRAAVSAAAVAALMTFALSACGGSNKAPVPPTQPTDSSAGVPGTIRVVVSGLRSERGNVRVALFRSADGFPRDRSRVAHRQIVPATGGAVTATFENISPGPFAAAVLHDENEDGVMEKSFIGKPKEGFGFSRNPSIGLSAPDFEECAVDLPPGGSIEIEVRLNN